MTRCSRGSSTLGASPTWCCRLRGQLCHLYRQRCRRLHRHQPLRQRRRDRQRQSQARVASNWTTWKRASASGTRRRTRMRAPRKLDIFRQRIIYVSFREISRTRSRLYGRTAICPFIQGRRGFARCARKTPFRAMLRTLHEIYQIYVRDGNNRSVQGHSAIYFKEEGLRAARASKLAFSPLFQGGGALRAPRAKPLFRAMVTTLHAIYQIYVQDGNSESVQGHFAIYLKFRKHLAKFAKPLLTRLIRIRS